MKIVVIIGFKSRPVNINVLLYFCNKKNFFRQDQQIQFSTILYVFRGKHEQMSTSPSSYECNDIHPKHYLTYLTKLEYEICTKMWIDSWQ